MDLENIFSQWKTQPNFSVTESKLALLRLKATIKRHEGELLTALNKDLGKSTQEAYMSELGLVYEEITHYLRHLKGFRRPHKAKTGLATFPSKAKVTALPWGKVLVLSPWNYPVLLSLDPLAGAVAAGNRVILKPSEFSPAVSQVIKTIVDEAFPDGRVRCLLGEADLAKELTSMPFDFIFFTGSTKVGQEVYKAAAEQLIPCVLELGGKSPCLVTKNADLKLAARRILFGKCLNAGQTCVAPDYLLVDSSVKEDLVQAFKEELKRLYPTGMLGNKDYPKIVSPRHLGRLLSLIDRPVLLGGQHNETQLEFTLLEADFASISMKEEIFGPVLPLIAYQDLDALLRELTSRPTPLAFYVFSSDKQEAEQILNQVEFGGAVINDTLMHLSLPSLPFGGKGASGMGSYHGRYSLECFSRKTPVLTRGKIDVPLRYPPYSTKKEGFIRKIMS